MKLNESTGRMFRSVTHTGTYYQGCDHLCPDCWTQWAFNKPMSHEPKLIQTDKNEILKVKNAVVFLNSAHDSGARCIPDEWISDMLYWIGLQDPSNKFLIQTQNIRRFAEKPHFTELKMIKDYVILSTTIRSDVEYKIGNVPLTNLVKAGFLARFREYGFRVRVSHEPLWKFNAAGLVRLDEIIKPELIEIGLDNYVHKHKLDHPKPEPQEYEVYRTLIKDRIQLNEKDSIRTWRKSKEYAKAMPFGSGWKYEE